MSVLILARAIFDVISSRQVYFFQESPAVISTTTDSGGLNTIKDSHRDVIKSHVESENYEHISDDTASLESEDTKGDGNNTPENTRSSGNMVISTMDPDKVRTVDIDTGPTDSAQVYHTNVKGFTC